MEACEREEFFNKVCDMIDLWGATLDDFLYILDLEKDYFYITRGAEKRFLLPSHVFPNFSEEGQKFIHKDDIQKLLDDVQELLTTQRNEHNLVYRWLSREGTPLWINCRGQIIREEGKARYLIGCINEVGTRQLADNVSGLLGETGFRSYLEQFPDKMEKGFLMRFGIDDLKGINVRLGVEYGDQILLKTAEVISANLLPGQKLYRILGDEFIVFDESETREEPAKQEYHRIRDGVDQFVKENKYEVLFTLSCGLVQCADVKEFGYDSIMRLTEFALDEAKRKGKNRCYSFREEDYAAFMRRRRLMLQLRRAVNNDFEGFSVYYQPIFKPDGVSLYGAEALMRFTSDGFGMVSPVEFIPILEETGLIIPAGRWILCEALKFCRECQKQIPDFHINVNLSNIQIMKSNVGGDLLRAVKTYGVNPEQVTIELTESGLLESDYRFTKIWNHSKEAGLELALDDFGTGYSNFHYLTELRPDVIKIDRNFTMKAVRNQFEYELLSLLSKMAHDLKLKICVEGIETEEERKIILQLQPDYMQGFYFGRPCSCEDFREQFLKEEI